MDENFRNKIHEHDIKEDIKKEIICPKCGSDKYIRIVYGYPSKSLSSDVKKGKIELGGCVIRGSNPLRRCRNCGIRYLSVEANLRAQDPTSDNSVLERIGNFISDFFGFFLRKK